MREPRTCAACGAKNHPDWRKCQRCKAPLDRSESEADATTRRLAAIAPIGAVIVVVAVSGYLLLQAPIATSPAPRKTSSRPGATPTAAVNDASTERRRQAAFEPATAGDFARRGADAFRTDDFGSAVAAYEAAVARQPDDPDAQNNLGQTLVRLNRAPEAIPRFQRATQLAPGKWTYRFNLARARGLCGDWAGAVEDYREADRLFPDDHATLFNLALALRKAGRLAEAAPVLERVVVLAPEDPSFVLTAARTYDELDRRTEAAASYRKFLDQTATGREADLARGRLAQLEAASGQQD
jgi:Flp pilus assembly protein TadD